MRIVMKHVTLSAVALVFGVLPVAAQSNMNAR